MAKMSAPPKPRKSQLANAAGGGPLERAAQGELDPVIAALTNAVNAKARASEAAISGYTNDYARQLGAVDAGAPYGPAISQQADVDAALRAALAGGGADLANQLSGRLAALGGSSGAGALGQEAGALSSQGESAGNTRLASGSASLGDLIANMAGARSFSKKLPGLAKLSGLQGIRQAEGNAQQEIAQGTSSAESQLPSIVNEIRGARQQARALKSENAYRSAEIGLSAQRNQISAQQGAARLGIEEQNANTAAARVAQEALNSNRSYGLSLSRLGIEQKSLQLRQLSAEAKLRGGGYTPAEAHKMQLTANQIAGDALKHTANLQQLMHTLALNDIPPSIGLKAAKLAGYKPGKIGMFSGLGNMFRKGLASEASTLLNAGRAAAGKGGEGVGSTGAQTVYSSALGHAGGFLPRGASFVMDRKDQGRDIQTKPGTPIIAPGNGYVVRVASDPGGGGAHFGPSYPIVFFTSGPYKGKYVYIGHTVSALRQGQHFRGGSVLSHTQRSSAYNGGAPDGWAEIGFAPGGSPGTFGQEAPF